MKSPDLLEPAASEEEAEMAKVALRCLMTALDQSNAPRIVLVDENGAYFRPWRTAFQSEGGHDFKLKADSVSDDRGHRFKVKADSISS